MGGLEYLLNPYARLGKRLHPGLDPGVDSNLEYECSVTQSPPGDYCYFKWWDGWPILRAEPRQKEKIGNTRVAPKSATPMFLSFPIFFVSIIDPLLPPTKVNSFSLPW